MMAKLQEIKRSNGSTVHHITIPKSIIEEAEWTKGDEIDFIIAENATNEKKTVVMEKVN